MKKLYEFSPGDIYNSVRGFVPHVKSAWNSARNAVRIAAVKSPNKRITYKNLINELYRCSKYDPTLFGDAVRGSETARQALGVLMLQNLPPLPTADTQSVKQTIESLIHTISRGNSNVVKKSKILTFLHNKFGINPNNAASRMRRTLTNPIKSAKDFVGNRATASTYGSVPITNYNSDMLRLANMPVIDNGNIMTVFQASGMDPLQYTKNTKDYVMGGIRNKISKIIPYSFTR